MLGWLAHVMMLWLDPVPLFVSARRNTFGSKEWHILRGGMFQSDRSRDDYNQRYSTANVSHTNGEEGEQLHGLKQRHHIMNHTPVEERLANMSRPRGTSTDIVKCSRHGTLENYDPHCSTIANTSAELSNATVGALEEMNWDSVPQEKQQHYEQLPPPTQQPFHELQPQHIPEAKYPLNATAFAEVSRLMTPPPSLCRQTAEFVKWCKDCSDTKDCNCYTYPKRKQETGIMQKCEYNLWARVLRNPCSKSTSKHQFCQASRDQREELVRNGFATEAPIIDKDIQRGDVVKLKGENDFKQALQARGYAWLDSMKELVGSEQKIMKSASEGKFGVEGVDLPITVVASVKKAVWRLSDAPSIGVGRKLPFEWFLDCRCGAKAKPDDGIIKCMKRKDNAEPFTMINLAFTFPLAGPAVTLSLAGNYMSRDFTGRVPSYRSLTASITLNLNAGRWFSLKFGGMVLFRAKEAYSMINLLRYSARSIIKQLLAKCLGGVHETHGDDDKVGKAIAEKQREKMKPKYLQVIKREFGDTFEGGKYQNAIYDAKELRSSFQSLHKYLEAEKKKVPEAQILEKEPVWKDNDILGGDAWIELWDLVKSAEGEAADRNKLTKVVNMVDRYARWVHEPKTIQTWWNKSVNDFSSQNLKEVDVHYAVAHLLTSVARRLANKVYQLFFTKEADNSRRFDDQSPCNFIWFYDMQGWLQREPDPALVAAQRRCWLTRLFLSKKVKKKNADEPKDQYDVLQKDWPIPAGATILDQKTVTIRNVVGTAIAYMPGSAARDPSELKGHFIRIPLEVAYPVRGLLKALQDKVVQVKSMIKQMQARTKTLEGEAWSLNVEPIRQAMGWIQEIFRDYTMPEDIFGIKWEDFMRGRQFEDYVLPDLFPAQETVDEVATVHDKVVTNLLNIDMFMFNLMLETMGFSDSVPKNENDEEMAFFVRFTGSVTIAFKLGEIEFNFQLGAFYQFNSATHFEQGPNKGQLTFMPTDVAFKTYIGFQFKYKPKNGRLSFQVYFKRQGTDLWTDYYILAKIKISLAITNTWRMILTSALNNGNELIEFIKVLKQRGSTEKDKDKATAANDGVEALEPVLEKVRAKSGDIGKVLNGIDDQSPNITVIRNNMMWTAGVTCLQWLTELSGLDKSTVSLYINVLHTVAPKKPTTTDFSFSLELATTVKTPGEAETGHGAKAGWISTYDLSSMFMDLWCPKEKSTINEESRDDAWSEKHEKMAEHGREGADAEDDVAMDDDGGDADD